MDHVAEGAQIPNFSLDAYLLSQPEEKRGTVGAYAQLLEINQQKIPNSPRYIEYPKCVKYGTWQGVAKDATHDAALRAKYDVVADESEDVVEAAPVQRRKRS